MKRILQKSLLQNVVRNRNGYLAISCGSLVINILLSIGLLFTIGKEKIVFVPPKIPQTFWVSHSDVSTEYLSEMSYFFSSLRFNITPVNADNQRETLLRYVCPEYFESLKIQLINEAEKISKEHINLAFYPIDIKVNHNKLEARVTGDLVSTVGIHQLPSQRVSYKIIYNYNSGRLLVKSFMEDNVNS
jgi:type IV conjugative transfer system protein TraE